MGTITKWAKRKEIACNTENVAPVVMPKIKKPETKDRGTHPLLQFMRRDASVNTINPPRMTDRVSSPIIFDGDGKKKNCNTPKHTKITPKVASVQHIDLNF